MKTKETTYEMLNNLQFMEFANYLADLSRNCAEKHDFEKCDLINEIHEKFNKL